jgi:type IX secretion system PorP/SprF family membrane protein
MRYYGINFNDPDFLVLEKNDPSIMDDVKTNSYYGNFGTGVCLVHDKYYVGISIPNLYNNDIGFSPEDYDDFAKESRHYYAMAGTRFALSEQLQLRPSVLLKYVENAPFDVEANVSLTIDNSVTAGLSYRAGGDGLGESIDLLAMYQLNKIALGLSYDVGISKISRSSSGSFEVLLRYDLIGIRSDIVNPRFFY